MMLYHLSKPLICGTLLSAVPVVLADPTPPSPPATPFPVFPEPPFIPSAASSQRNEHRPFQKTIRFTIGNEEKEGYAEIPVAGRQRLVIEHVSALVQGPAGQKYFASLRTTIQRNETAWHYLVLSQQYAGAGVDVYAASQPIRAYADPDEFPIRFSVSRGLDDTGTVSVDATISGYLVDR
ncbi:hypothetical protein [Methylococcus capsulatus]|jgi:hypothetical protein|uniref:Lipoprotein n=1 Tax=Methylococcus capsulatus TaxID=414 RepID=A0AA35XYW0_METCP|nr:hypothetical protein [Methylococcus capsulatus]CAI8834014.1 exported protein of unknown function [Methylococcus capsulatus]